MSDNLDDRRLGWRVTGYTTFADRLFSKIQQPANSGACWFWFGAKGRGGRAQIHINGKNTGAARVLWSMVNKTTFPAGLFALHLCDNPGCVNPEHIRPGTQHDNMQDASNRRRLAACKQTHCVKGHQLSGDNVRVRTKPNGRTRRDCMKCVRLRSLASYHRSAYRRRDSESAR